MESKDGFEKMNKSDSVSGTLSYLDDLTSKKTQRNTQVVKESSLSNENPSPPKDTVAKSIAAAEPHLKNFANMLSEEISNVKKARVKELEKIRQEELEKIRAEKAAKIKLQEAEKLRLEEERKRILAEEAAAVEAEFLEKERERTRAELLKQEEMENQEASLELTESNEVFVPVEDIITEAEEPKEAEKEQIDESLLLFSNNKDKKQIQEQTDFVTFNDLKKHYSDFINKINTQLSTLGGGGEVLLKRLDDIDMSTVENGDFISFDATTGKFVGGSIPTIGEEGGIVEGGTF